MISRASISHLSKYTSNCKYGVNLISAKNYDLYRMPKNMQVRLNTNDTSKSTQKQQEEEPPIDLKHSIKDWLQEKRNMENKIADLTKEHKAAEAKVNNLTKEHKAVEAKVNNLTKEHKAVEAKVNNLLKEHKAVEAKVNNLLKEHKAVEAKVRSLPSENNIKEDKLMSMNTPQITGEEDSEKPRKWEELYNPWKKLWAALVALYISMLLNFPWPLVALIALYIFLIVFW